MKKVSLLAVLLVCAVLFAIGAVDSNAKDYTDVNIINQPVQVEGAVKIDNIKEPWQMNGEVEMQEGVGGAADEVFTVPDDKHLTIKFRSTHAILPYDQIPTSAIQIGPFANGLVSYSTMPGKVPAKFVNDSRYGNELVLLHAGPGEEVIIFFFRSAAEGDAHFDYVLSGYLEPSP